jgi:3-mercaptopyruvate sulfurtransferase SseA
MGQETPEFQHRLFGHIPGSFNIPTNELLTEFGTFKSREDIFALFAKKKVDIRHGFILVGSKYSHRN